MIEVRDEGRAFFAEVAEAVGVATSDVMSALWNPGEAAFHVLYTKGIEEVPEEEVGNAMIFHRKIRRGEDGILIHDDLEREVGTADEFFARIEDQG